MMIAVAFLAGGCFGAVIGFFTASMMVMSKQSEEREPSEFSHGWKRRP